MYFIILKYNLIVWLGFDVLILLTFAVCVLCAGSGTTLYVYNLAFSASQDMLETLFDSAQSINILTKDNGQSRG